MSYQALTWLHLLTVVPALLIGSWLMLRRKGTPHHRQLGRAFMLLMLATGLLTLLMPAELGPRLLDHFGGIHALSLLTIVSVPRAWQAARRRQLIRHRYYMIGLYVGGLLVAGFFALMPGRSLHTWLFG